jgi:hypothetical protein
MALQKKEHWQTRAYHAFLLERARVPFAWGANDCALFAADGILAITGTDIADDFRGKYSTEAEAFALIKTVTGGTTVADAAAWCANKHGLRERVHPLMAQRGDLVVVESSGLLISGLVHLNGRHVVVASGKGLNRLPIMNVKRSWEI